MILFFAIMAIGSEQAENKNQFGEITHQKTPGLGTGSTVKKKDKCRTQEEPFPTLDR